MYYDAQPHSPSGRRTTRCARRMRPLRKGKDSINEATLDIAAVPLARIDTAGLISSPRP